MLFVQGCLTRNFISYVTIYVIFTNNLFNKIYGYLKQEISLDPQEKPTSGKKGFHLPPLVPKQFGQGLKGH
jgi:hypothetical protein